MPAITRTLGCTCPQTGPSANMPCECPSRMTITWPAHTTLTDVAFSVQRAHARHAREIAATQHLIDGTLWTLTADQLHNLMTDLDMPATIREAAHREWDAKSDRGR